MKPAIAWHSQAELLGVRVRAWFADPDQPPAEDPVIRLLPFLAGGAPQPLSPPGQRLQCRAAGLVAQPDLVVRHGNGLLCLGSRPQDNREHDPQAWPGQLSVDAVLQGLAAAMAVSAHFQEPTAALWRVGRAVYQFDPGAQVMECLATHIGEARLYWNEPAEVSPAQLASFCEPRLRAIPGLTHSEPASAMA